MFDEFDYEVSKRRYANLKASLEKERAYLRNAQNDLNRCPELSPMRQGYVDDVVCLQRNCRMLRDAMEELDQKYRSWLAAKDMVKTI